MIRNIFLLFSVYCCCCITGSANTYTLFNKGLTAYSIIISNESSPSEKFAAYEMQKYLKEIGGVTLKIQSEKYGKRGKRIVIGYNRIAKLCDNDLQKPTETDQSYRYFNVGGDIIIVGGSNIGTLYGVYSFLENELGCRWLTSKVSFVPHKESCFFSSFNVSSSPSFVYRYIYTKGAHDKLWSLRNTNNGIPDKYLSMYGDIQDCQYPYWSVHTFDRFVPPSLYFKSHPEYYSLIKGKREAKQLCLTNSKVKELCIKGLREIIIANPNYKVYDLSQNDNISSCHCYNCNIIKSKYGSESGLIVWFVNSVAKELKRDFPDKYIGTLAYQYSQKPPKSIVPFSNVFVRLSLINTCLIHNLENCPKNKSAGEDVKNWHRLTQNLFVWDYISTSRIYYAPIPNIEAIKSRLVFYKENGVKGVFIEGNSGTAYGEFADLRNYVISKLLWKPYLNLDNLVCDFINRYYGNVAAIIKEYYELTQERAKKTNIHLFFVMDHRNAVYSEGYLESAYSILSQAEKKANSKEIMERVRNEKMSVAYMLCKVNPRKSIINGALDFVRMWTNENKIQKFAGYGENVDKERFFEQMKQFEN